jgi:phenylalanyl-tRNA synthetase beta chain
MIEQLTSQIGITTSLTFKPVANDQPFLHPYQSANIYLNDVCVGYCGAVHPTLAKSVDVKHSWIMEVNLDDLHDYPKQPVAYQTVYKFPKVEKDLAFVLDQSQSIDQLKSTILNTSSHIERVDVFDVFESEKLGQDKHSIALNVQFTANQMYTDDMINDILKQVIAAVKNDLEGEIRL